MTLNILAFQEPNSFGLHSRDLSENWKKKLILHSTRIVVVESLILHSRYKGGKILPLCNGRPSGSVVPSCQHNSLVSRSNSQTPCISNMTNTGSYTWLLKFYQRYTFFLNLGPLKGYGHNWDRVPEVNLKHCRSFGHSNLRTPNFITKLMKKNLSIWFY